MLVTGYHFLEARRRAEVAYIRARSAGWIEARLGAAKRLSRITAAQSEYELINRVTVRLGDGPVQMKLCEAVALEEQYLRIIDDDEGRLRHNSDAGSDMLLAFNAISSDYAAVRAAVAEGRANKLDTEVHGLNVVGIF